MTPVCLQNEKTKSKKESTPYHHLNTFQGHPEGGNIRENDGEQHFGTLDHIRREKISISFNFIPA
jgi:hypothetical protein